MEQRRTQRYKMQLPLQIVQVGDQKVNRLEKTQDISSGGVCFLSNGDLEIGGRIEYLITLAGTHPPVRIRCLGKVLRSERPDTPPGPGEDGIFEVALTMERYQFIKSDEFEARAVSA